MNAWFLLAFLLFYGCTNTKPGLFTKKTAHEAYRSGLAAAGLLGTRMGVLWQEAALRSLQSPVSIELPYKENGYFASNDPRAAGYSFNVQRGEKVQVQVSTRPASGILLFVELYEMPPGKAARLLQAADTLTTTITHTAEQSGQYLLRVQPELLQSVSYILSVSTGPSLAFPIRPQDKPRIISTWGAGRDAGKRQHEGIDIQAKKRTPVVAVASGFVSRVTENGLGGKVVFLQPENSRVNVYYAHLDTQWVRQGQQVQTGDTLGLTGNTGNARNTVSHLHFGIYTGSGAVDPLPFVSPDRPAAPEPRGDTSLFISTVHINDAGKLVKGIPAKIIAFTADRYQLLLPDNNVLLLPKTSVAFTPLGQQRLNKDVLFLDAPDSTAAIIAPLAAGSRLMLLGKFNGYSYLRWGEREGWVKE